MTDTFQCKGGCGREIKNFPRRKTPYCRTCNGVAIGSDPERAEKSRRAMKDLMRDPLFRARHVQRTAEGLRRRLADDPEEAARRREVGRALGKSGLGHAVQGPGSEPRMRVGRMQTERLLGWCPRHLRDQYRDLVNKKGVRAAEARQIIERQVEAENARLSPFEKQLLRVRNGQATVVDKFKPRRDDTGPFTLGGVSTGLL